jgi:type IV pilus assembly protein PilE
MERTAAMHRVAARRGFTLLELMIVVAVVAILAMIALPAYFDSVRKSRRADAIASLSAVQQAQERWRANCPQYAASIALPASGASCSGAVGLGLAASSAYYTYAVTGATATGYTATATAKPGTSQASDKALGVSCTPLSVTASGVTSPTQCWSR